MSKKRSIIVFASSSKCRGNEAALFLDIVWSGLEHLCQEVKRVERERAERRSLTEERAQNISYCTFGSEEGDSMICNYFLWYANALHNFIGVFKKAFLPSEDLEGEFRAVMPIPNEAMSSATLPKVKRARFGLMIRSGGARRERLIDATV